MKLQKTILQLACLLLALLCPAFVRAQASPLWTARYHGPVAGSSDTAVAMALDNTGHVYVTGQSQGAGTGVDYATVAYDAKGNQLWAARYDGPASGDDLVNAMAVDSKAGHVYVSGLSQGAGTETDYATVAYDFNGNQLWVARYSGAVNYLGGFGDNASIAVDSKTGNVYLAGETSPVAGFNPKTTIVAYDPNGNQLWSAFDNTNIDFASDVTFPRAVVADAASGNVYITGAIYFVMRGGTNVRTVAYDNAGTQLWAAQVELGDPQGTRTVGAGITVGPTGTIYVAAEGDPAPAPQFCATVAYDATGHQLWLTVYAAPKGDAIPSGIAVDNSSSNVYVTGLSGFQPTDFLTQAYDANGNQRWVANYGAAGTAVGTRAIAVDSGTGNVYVAGESNCGSFAACAANQGNYATVAYDSKGNQLWASTFTGGGANAIAVDSNSGNVYVTGQGQDASGGTDFTTIAYSQVQDTTPPVTTVTASPAPNSNGWNNTNVTVTLSSTDSEAGASGVKQIQYGLSGVQALDTQTAAASTAFVVISAEGATTLSYFGTDNAGNKEQSKTLTVQIDKTVPAFSGMPASGCTLWPPNNQMVTVGTITAADALSGLAAGTFQVSGSSSEPSEPSNPDVVITPNGSGGYVVQLRAARLGSGTGRTYTISATATDLAGNTATSTVTCAVPRNITH